MLYIPHHIAHHTAHNRFWWSRGSSHLRTRPSIRCARLVFARLAEGTIRVHPAQIRPSKCRQHIEVVCRTWAQEEVECCHFMRMQRHLTMRSLQPRCEQTSTKSVQSIGTPGMTLAALRRGANQRTARPVAASRLDCFHRGRSMDWHFSILWQGLAIAQTSVLFLHPKAAAWCVQSLQQRRNGRCLARLASTTAPRRAPMAGIQGKARAPLQLAALQHQQCPRQISKRKSW